VDTHGNSCEFYVDGNQIGSSNKLHLIDGFDTKNLRLGIFNSNACIKIESVRYGKPRE